MSSLREIKDRIGSVKSTLKITSAMKLVASSKLHKAQNAIELMRPYEESLMAALSVVRRQTAVPPASGNAESGEEAASSLGRTAIVAFSSNSSLCGGFNANVTKKALSEAEAAGNPVVFAVGRKVAEAMRKAGFGSETDLTQFSAKPTYAAAESLSSILKSRFDAGEFSRVILVYTHFISTSRQEVVVETLLPFEDVVTSSPTGDEDFIVEPSAEEIIASLAPKVAALRLYSAALDSAASEHSARTVAMQTATDNGNDLLSELTLEYNKGRQQKITAEILDLVGGASQSSGA